MPKMASVRAFLASSKSFFFQDHQLKTATITEVKKAKELSAIVTISFSSKGADLSPGHITHYPLIQKSAKLSPPSDL